MLRIAADAACPLIDRQQKRLLLEIELNPLHVNGAFGLRVLTREEVLQAGNFVDGPDTRLLEELFWVHAMDGDLRGEPSALLLAVRRQPAGAVARHNLAVLQTIRGQESEPSAWAEALQEWKSLLNDPSFWNFINDRAGLIGARGGSSAKLKAEISSRLSAALATQLALAGKAEDAKTVTLLTGIIRTHRDWLDLDTAFQSVGEQVRKEAFVSLGSVLDRVADLRPQDDKPSIHRVLAQGEEDLGRVVAAYEELIRGLGDVAIDEGWEEAVCESYQRLMLASFGLLGEVEQAGRLMKQARTFVSDPRLLASLQRDGRHIQWSVLYEEAKALLQAGGYAAAEQKLAEAVAFSALEHQQQIVTLQELIRSAREAAERQSRVERRNHFYREAKLCMQKEDFAAAEQNLAAAMSFCGTEEEKTDIEAMEDRCYWLRIMTGIDNTDTRPALYKVMGCGTAFLGWRDYDVRSESYLTDHWLTALFIPIFPLGTYRVSDTGAGSYSIYGRASLSPRLKKAQWAIPAAALALVLAIVFSRGSTLTTAIAATSVRTANPTQEAVTIHGAVPLPTPVVHSKLPIPARDERAPERDAISALARSLADRKRSLEQEEAKLEKQRRSLQAVEIAYHREVVPPAVRAIYYELFDDYQSHMKQHERKLAQWRADDAAYHHRVNAESRSAP